LAFGVRRETARSDASRVGPYATYVVGTVPTGAVTAERQTMNAKRRT
jgi:hypothetical protein